MKFKKGQKVSVLDDAISGVVLKIQNELITILTSEGFELEFHTSELIIEPDDTVIKNEVLNANFQQVIKNKETHHKRRLSIKPKTKDSEKLVVDLHIHQLVEKYNNMGSFEILNLQLDTAKRQLEFAISKRLPHIVFIHGVGEGVLKMELQTLLRRYDNVTFYDADYKTFGLGATEVRIFQNVVPS